MKLKHFAVIVLLASSVSWAQSPSSRSKSTSTSPSSTPSKTENAAAPDAAALAGPSLEDTLRWITDKVNFSANGKEKHYSFGWVNSETRYSITFPTECEARINKHWTFSGRRAEDNSTYGGNRDTSYVVSLWDIDKVGVGPARGAPFLLSIDEAEFYFTWLEGSGTEKVRVHEQSSTSGDTNFRLKQVPIGFGAAENDNEDLAKRVAKAFEHAVALCKQRKPASNEPF